MSKFIIDYYNPAKHLPVQVSHDGMELLETSLSKTQSDGKIFVLIGETIESTPSELRQLLNEYFPGILEEAVEEECEYICFYI